MDQFVCKDILVRPLLKVSESNPEESSLLEGSNLFGTSGMCFVSL